MSGGGGVGGRWDCIVKGDDCDGERCDCEG